MEFDADLVAALRKKFPRARVLRMDAAALGDAGLLTLSPVRAVISGLPVLIMPDSKVKAIISAAFGLLGDGGTLYQFTYGPVCPVRKPIRDALGLKATHMGRVLKNLPPASVYRIQRAGAS